MIIRRQCGFTLIELMVSVAILGVLLASAIPVYNTWLQRAYGREASIMVKQIIDAQIIYNLEHDSFYTGEYYFDENDSSASAQILESLKISVPKGHPLKYQLIGEKEFFRVTITADFVLFKGGYTGLYGQIDSTGAIMIFPI